MGFVVVQLFYIALLFGWLAYFFLSKIGGLNTRFLLY
jgi:hypothetical protein